MTISPLTGSVPHKMAEELKRVSVPYCIQKPTWILPDSLLGLLALTTNPWVHINLLKTKIWLAMSHNLIFFSCRIVIFRYLKTPCVFASPSYLPKLCWITAPSAQPLILQSRPLIVFCNSLQEWLPDTMQGLELGLKLELCYWLTSCKGFMCSEIPE